MLFFFIVLLLVDFSSAKCPEGAIPIPSAYGSKWPCLLFSNSKVRFLRAENECVSKGGHLVSVPNGFFDSFIARESLKT